MNEAETCCGFPMIFQDIWGVRRYACQYRAHHQQVFVNLVTGERTLSDDVPWQEQKQETPE